jgi:hypothetical protein
LFPANVETISWLARLFAMKTPRRTADPSEVRRFRQEKGK